MRYRLRTLLIVLALGPPVLAGAWFVALAWGTRPVNIVGTTMLFLCIVLSVATLTTDNG
jgi:hypothetical protein